MRRWFPLLALLSAAPLHAGTFYIKAGGNSSACLTATSCAGGTQCPSWFAFTGQHLPVAGDIINFCSGTYRETVTLAQSGTNGNPITLRKEPGEPVGGAVISGLNTCSSWTADGSGVFHCAYIPTDTFCTQVGLPQLFVDGVPLPEYQAADCPATVTNLGDGTFKTCSNYPAKVCTVNADCNNLANTSGTCQLGAWCWNHTTQTLFVRKTDGTSPAGNTVEASARHRLLSIDNQNYVTLDGLNFVAGASTGEFDPGISMQNVGGVMNFTNNIYRYASGMGIFTTVSGSPPLTLVATGNSFTDMGQGVAFFNNNAGDCGQGVVDSNGTFMWRLQHGGFNTTSETFSSNTMTRVTTHNWARGIGGGNCGSNANSDRCFMTGFAPQGFGGSINVNDNVGTDIENLLLLKMCTGAVMNAGSSISRNTALAPAPDVGKFAYTVVPLIRAACEWSGTLCTGGLQDCTIGGASAPIWHQLVIDRNRLLNGRQGIVVSANNLQGGDAYTVGVFNNFIQSGDGIFGQPHSAAFYAHTNSAGIKVFNNSMQCLHTATANGAGAESATGAGVDWRNNIFDFPGCSSGTITDNSSVDTWNSSGLACEGSTPGCSNVCDAANLGHCVTGANALVYTNEAVADFHITSDPSVVVTDKGATLSSFFNTDFDGGSRPQGAAWDIGADEIGSGTTTTSSSIPTTSSTSSSSTSSTSTTSVTSTSSTSTSSVTTTSGTTTSSSTSSSTSTSTSSSTSTSNPGAMCFHCKDSNCRIGQ